MNKYDVNRLLKELINDGKDPLQALDILKNDHNVDNKAIDEWVDSLNQYRGNK